MKQKVGVAQPSINGSLASSGAGSLLRLWVCRRILKRGVWSSSSPNTTGVTRLDEAAGASNITFRMPHGKYGRPPTLDLKETPALFMGLSSPTFCSDALIARSWPMARPS
ncbi:MAG TPA: hypothetical protein VK788_22810 [Terriglobales bacterium]|nr:hypothetical protein [Terriglobales bacterium]